MRNKELERIATILAQPGEERTDGECLGEVWQFLVDCGIDPDDFRPEETAPAASPAETPKQFAVGQELSVRSLGDWDCVFRFTVVKRTAKFVTLLYHGLEHKVAIRHWSDGVEYCYPLGLHSMAPMLRCDEVVR
jgi:hypothetical protein